jgi:hypothetical protein
VQKKYGRIHLLSNGKEKQRVDEASSIGMSRGIFTLFHNAAMK